MVVSEVFLGNNRLSVMSDNKILKNEKKVKNSDSQKESFNKKKWRENRYSIKAKAKKWENERKKRVIRKYHKELEKNGFQVEKKIIISSNTNKLTSFKKAQLEYQRIREEKQKEKEEKQRKAKETKEALEAYKAKKLDRFKKLSQKTKKGQPVMKGRIELLLKQIEKNYAS